MNLKLILDKIGLAGNESKVYLALLSLGSALAGEITKESEVNRTNVYDALDKLVEKGLVSYVIEANRKYFQAAPLKNYTYYLEEKKKTIIDKKKLLTNIIPELEKIRQISKDTHEAILYRGRKGIKSIAEDIINTKQEMLVFGAEGKFVELFTHYAENWHTRRAKANIVIKIIFNELLRNKKENADKKWKKAAIRFTKQETTPSTTWVYGDKVVVIIWEENPLATLIRSKHVAASYKEFFKVLWNSAKK